MPEYASLSRTELEELHQKLLARYAGYQAQRLKLDMSRGKPGADQLDLSLGMLTCLDGREACMAEDGTDCRNYGVLAGIPEAKRLFAGMLGVAPDEIIIGGNSSLNMMYDMMARAMTHGVPGSPTPWCRLPKVRFLCPCPGYDRHFAICEHFGIDMIDIDMTPDGPDMAAVKRLAESDDSIKGIWCVPQYSNPQGYTYSDATVDAFAALKPAALDFRIFWDDAYCVHHLDSHPDHLKNILTACRQTGRENMIYIFGSTSKITFPGAGVAMLAASRANVAAILRDMAAQTIGSDKLNQLRHVRFFQNMAGIEAHMKRHAALIKPKFDKVTELFARNFAGTGIASWTTPHGGYFISFDGPDGCARRTVELCRAAGVKVTPAGATFPYHRDPRDRNIRIAPTMPPVDELATAIELFCLCVKIAAVEKRLAA